MTHTTTRPELCLTPVHRQALANFNDLPDPAEIGSHVVAALLSISEKTVWKWTKTGQIPAPVRRGGITRWKVGDVRRMLADRA